MPYAKKLHMFSPYLSNIHGRNADIADLTDANSSTIEYFETSVFYKQLQFSHTGRHIQVGSAHQKSNLLDKLRKSIKTCLYRCRADGQNTLDSEEIFYDDDTEIIPAHWHDLEDDATDRAMQEKYENICQNTRSADEKIVQRERDLTNAQEIHDFLRWQEEDSLFATKLAAYIIVRRAIDTDATDLFADCPYTESSTYDDVDCESMSWERDVKQAILHPLFTKLLRMQDDQFGHMVHEMASMADRDGDLDGGSVTSYTIDKVRMRIIEISYAIRVMSKKFWREEVESSEPAAVKEERLQTRDDIASKITQNQECICFDIETKFIPHANTSAASRAAAHNKSRQIPHFRIKKLEGAKTSRQTVHEEKKYWERSLKSHIDATTAKQLHYANIFQEEELRYDDKRIKRGKFDTGIQKNILDKCIREKQHLDRHQLDRIWNDSTLFENPIVFECRRLTSGSTIINDHRSLYINVHGPRNALFLRFKSAKQAKKMVKTSALIYLINYLRTVGRLHSIVDAKLSTIRTFREAVCGPKHAVKIYCTGSGPSSHRLLHLVKTDSYLSEIFTPEVHDTAITGFNRFMVSKNLKPIGVFVRQPKRCRDADHHKCSASTFMHGYCSSGDCDFADTITIRECKAWDASDDDDAIRTNDTRRPVFHTEYNDNAVTTSFFKQINNNKNATDRSPSSTPPGQCDEIIAISSVKFNHERNPTTKKCTFQEHVIFLVTPPNDKDGNPPPLCATGGKGDLRVICDDVIGHIKGVDDSQRDLRSRFVTDFELNMIPNKTVFLIACASESEMLLRFQLYARTAHVLMGFNSNCFDWPTIENRFRELCPYGTDGAITPKNYTIDRKTQPTDPAWKKPTAMFNRSWTYGLSYRLETKSEITYKIKIDEQNKIIQRRRSQWDAHLKNKRIAKQQTTILEEVANGEDRTASNFVIFFSRSGSTTTSNSSSTGDGCRIHKRKTSAAEPSNSGSKRRKKISTTNISTASRTKGQEYENEHSAFDDDSDLYRSNDSCLLSGMEWDSTNQSSSVPSDNEIDCKTAILNAKDEDGADGIEVQGINDIFKRTKYLSLNDKISIDIMPLVANNASKMCELNSAAFRMLGIRKLDDPRVKYINLCKTYKSGDTDVVVKYSMLDVVLPALMFMDMDSMNFSTCVSCKTTQPPRIVYQEGAMALVGAVLANNGTWYEHITMPGLTEKITEDDMKKADFIYDNFVHYHHLKYPGGIRGAKRSIIATPCACVDATNMYPRIIMKEDVGMTGLLTMTHIMRRKLKRNVDYELIKLTTVFPRDNRIVHRVFAKALYKIYHTIESYTAKDMLGQRLHFKSLMHKENDPYIKESYNQKQKTFKLLLNIIYGFCGLTYGVIGALITMYGREQTIRIARLWKEYTGEAICNSDTDSDFLLMCSEYIFKQLSRYVDKLKLEKRACSKSIVDKAISDVNKFLDDHGNVNQAPSKFLFEKYFLNGSVCQGPKNYCGWKIEENGRGKYNVSLHVAGLPGSKEGATSIKTKLQLWNMRFILDRDPDGALMFGDVVYDIGFRTILIEEVLVAMLQIMCNEMDDLKAKNDQKGVKSKLKEIAEFENNKDQARKLMANKLMTLDPTMVQGKEKVGDMQKSNTIACKAAALECRKQDMPLDKAPLYVILTRSCQAQISGVETSFLQTVLSNCPTEKKRLHDKTIKSKRTEKLTSAHLTKFPDAMLADADVYAYEFKASHYSTARDMLAKIDRLEGARDKLLCLSGSTERNLETEAKLLLDQEDKLSRGDRLFVKNCSTNDTGKQSQSEKIRDRMKKKARDDLAQRALCYMEHIHKKNDRMSLVVMTDPDYAISDLEDFAEIDQDISNGDPDIESLVKKFYKNKNIIGDTVSVCKDNPATKYYAVHIDIQPTHRTVDLWAIYTNRAIDFRWFVLSVKFSVLYTVADDGNKGLGRLVIGKVMKRFSCGNFTPEYNSSCDERILLSDKTQCKDYYIIDMHKYRVQTRSTPFITDTTNNDTELINRDSFCPNRKNSLAFDCDGMTLVKILDDYIDHTRKEHLPKSVHRLIRVKPLVGTNDIEVHTTTVNRKDKNRGKYVFFDDSAIDENRRWLLPNCTIVRDDDRHQSKWTWDDKGACIYLDEIALTLDKIKRSRGFHGFSTGTHRLELVFYQDIMELVLCKRRVEKDENECAKYEIPITHIQGGYRDVDKYGQLCKPTHRHSYQIKLNDDVKPKSTISNSSAPLETTASYYGGLSSEDPIPIGCEENDDFLDEPKMTTATKKLIQKKLSVVRI